MYATDFKLTLCTLVSRRGAFLFLLGTVQRSRESVDYIVGSSTLCSFSLRPALPRTDEAGPSDGSVNHARVVDTLLRRLGGGRPQADGVSAARRSARR